MTDVASGHTDRISVRIAAEEAATPKAPVPTPGPMSLFVVFIAVAAGLVAALGFQAMNPDTPIVILGGTVLAAAVFGIVGLYRYEWFLLATLAIRPALDDLIADEFGTFQPSAILGILAILVTLLHLISLRSTGNWNRPTPLGFAFIGFFVMFVPSFITSVDRGVSQGAMFGIASVTLLYLACEQAMLRERAFVWKLLIASGIGMIVPILTGYVQFFWTGNLDEGGSGLVRIDGSFAHPNPFASYLVFSLLILIAVIPTLDVRRKLWVGSLTFLAGFIMIATFARGAWASFLIGSMLMAYRVNKKFVWVILGGAIVAGAVVPGVGDRVGNLFATTGEGGGAKTDDSLAWRIGYWGKVWPLFWNNPVSGVGIDATKTLTVEAKDPHNSFIQPLIEGGIIGGIGFFALLFVASKAGLSVWRRLRRGEFENPEKMLAVGALAGLFSIAAQLVTENVLLNTILWWYLNVALAYIAVLTWGPKPPPEPEPDLNRLQLPAAGETTRIEGQGIT
jgi:O-antigen ligase